MEPDHQYEPYKIIEYGGTGEIEEKKSRFIAHVAAAGTEEEALAFIEAKKKQFWDARHNCYAFVLGERGQTMRFSDDGEPAGTAGKPILEVLSGSGIRNAVVVVTRYFGGTLLGTGGLVRAYSKAVQEGLGGSRLIEKKLGRKVRIGCDYNMIGKVQYQIAQAGILTLDSRYTEDVETLILVPEREVDQVTEMLTQATGAKASVSAEEQVWFAAFEKEILLFER